MRLLLLLMMLAICVAAHSQVTLNLQNPPSLPLLFGEGIISTRHAERDFALSPDGNELFFTLQSPVPNSFQTILHSKRSANGDWSTPEVASFAGNYTDLEPAFSADGQRLYFASNRPIASEEKTDFDIWMVEKQNGVWTNAVNLGAPVNTLADEYYPAITKSGNLYYTAAYKNGIGREDIFVSKWLDGKYQPPVAMDTAINSPMYEFNSFVSPDEDYIIFTSYGRKDDAGGGDLYMSRRDAMGKWQPAKNLQLLNSNRIDYCPFVSFNKKILFFTSERHNIPRNYPDQPTTRAKLLAQTDAILNGHGNIYWIDFEEVLR